MTAKLLNVTQELIVMAEYNMQGLYDDIGYRLRHMKSIIMQIRKYHADCQQQWEKLANGTIGSSEMEDLIRTFSWLKRSIHAFLEQGEKGVEGMVWSEMEEIVRDVREKEKELESVFLYSVEDGVFW